MATKKLYGTTFWGNEASDYAIENGYLDYATFSKAFDAVLNNNIYQQGWNIGLGWEQENGYIDNTDEIDELQEQIDDLKEEQEEIEDTSDLRYEEIENDISDLQDKIDELQCEMDDQQDVYQWFIVSSIGADLIQKYTNDPLYYHSELDMYLWGVTHFGTSWSYVLTDIKLNCGASAFEDDR